jgi:hypothetical protein
LNSPVRCRARLGFATTQSTKATVWAYGSVCVKVKSVEHLQSPIGLSHSAAEQAVAGDFPHVGKYRLRRVGLNYEEIFYAQIAEMRSAHTKGSRRPVFHWLRTLIES